MPPSRIIRAAAPIRICDNGGWTDTSVARHGKVFNIAVRPMVGVCLELFPRGTREAPVVINAKDYAVRYAPALDEPGWGPHPLLEAALRAIRPPDGVDIEVTMHSRAPAGASTGTSAAAVVALLGALDSLAGGCRSALEIAYLAHAVETRWLRRQSGIQDQLCAGLGGVNFIEITEYPHAVVTPLRLAPRIHRELQRRLALIYLGRSHSSSREHEKVTRDLERLGASCPQLEALRAAAERSRDAVMAGDFPALGLAMRLNTDAQAALHPDLVQADAWRVIETARAHGAIGWKVNGAGGDGGSITLLCDTRTGAKHAAIRAIGQELPASAPIPIAICRGGLRVW